MKEKSVLHINIPNPCAQNWEAMPKAGDGKHCAQCNNVVYDFSQMNDNELLNFFKQSPAMHCGRFHNSQLNRDILPVIKGRKLLISKFNKIAAAFFTVLSFKALTSTAVGKNLKPSIVYDSNQKNKAQLAGGKIIISGTIKDSEGKPLEKATVAFDSAQVAITDAEGKFSFEIATVTATSHNLYFSYGDLITAVRTYHPAMLAANYDVALQERSKGEPHTMGIMLPPGYIGEMPSLLFKNNSVKLSADNKATLATIIVKMKNNPEAHITVTAYSGERLQHSRGKNLGDISIKRLEVIRKYLVEKGGISTDRIETVSEMSEDNYNIVDIKSEQ